jgi:hypothetical protein
MEISKLKELSQSLIVAKQERDYYSRLLDEASAVFEKSKQAMLEALNAADLDKFTDDGITVSITERTSVQVPKTLEQKHAFFEYLKERGIYEEMVSVNSARLNAFYKEEERLQLEQGNIDFKIPGLDEVTTYQQLNVRTK